MQLAYNETSEGTLGPFNVEAKLTSVGGSVLYATGSGRVSLIALNYALHHLLCHALSFCCLAQQCPILSPIGTTCGRLACAAHLSQKPSPVLTRGSLYALFNHQSMCKVPKSHPSCGRALVHCEGTHLFVALCVYMQIACRVVERRMQSRCQLLLCWRCCW